ncbi:hypothetical protein EGR_06159 [Echinococcus granulosus]|uniref:Uncharacterized protein n=1 Tax=Echinococcus granulosus TaxID=6210 RepID=W6UCG6_ECHGR|nr:hypothetical protein EGR_06159 [Echinococcus granulosus]EUB58940.1 hypothetical protein EGR_06159 [Echinococcus granulosus]
MSTKKIGWCCWQHPYDSLSVAGTMVKPTDYQYEEFVDRPKMRPIMERAVWLSVDLPGQGDGEEELPPSIDHVVLFGEGAGANILARFAMLHDEMVMGAVLIHCTGQTASFADSLRDKASFYLLILLGAFEGGLVNWKLKTIGMNPATESFLILHRFGYVSQLVDLLSSEDEWEVTLPYLLMLTAKISVATIVEKIEVMQLSASNILFTAQLIRLLVVVVMAILWSATASSPMNSPQQTAGIVDRCQRHNLIHVSLAEYNVKCLKDTGTELELKQAIEHFRGNLQHSINPRNLNRYITAYMQRKPLSERLSDLKCSVLLITGALAPQRRGCEKLYEALMKVHSAKSCATRELVVVENVANVLAEKPDKVIESMQYFLQGIGLGESLMSLSFMPPPPPMVNVSMQVWITSVIVVISVSHIKMQTTPLNLNRRMSMEDYDKPMGRIQLAGGFRPNLAAPNDVAEESSN